MSQPESNNLSEFLKNFPRQEIIETLNTIDQKIGSLHTISSKDFLFFNKLLKDYYKHIKEIADNNTTLSTFFKKELNKFAEQVNKKNQNQQKNIAQIKETGKQIEDILTLTFSQLDLIIVPFNNYKQNLITLKYLLANLKLHFTYINLPNKTELQSSVNTLSQNIDTIQQKFEVVGSGSDSLNNQIIELKDNLCITKTLGIKETSEQLRKLSIQIKKILFDEYWSDDFIGELNRRTQNCFANMGEIITNIQYHDIIRQKMEHIQTSQKELIKGLSDLKESETPDKSLENQLGFIAKIPEITDIQVAQLLYTNKDYQTSIEKITNKLVEVGREMKELNNLYKVIISNSNQFEDVFINEAKEAQQHYFNFMNQSEEDWIQSLNKINGLFDVYYSLKKEFSEIFISEKTLRGEIKNFEGLIKANGKNFGHELMRRLLLLLSELQMNSNSLKTNLNQITQHFASLQDLLSPFNTNQKNDTSIHDNLLSLSSSFNHIKQTAQQYGSLSLKISSEITSSFKSIEYYNYFKNTIEEIVTFLNEINKKVNYDNLKSFIGDNKEILKQIEKLYTMQSERDIHQQMVETGGISEINSQQNNDDLNDDIELF
jgi:methyl-accepting chemotaxis protein